MPVMHTHVVEHFDWTAIEPLADGLYALLGDGQDITNPEDQDVAWYVVADGLCSEVHGDGSLHYWWQRPGDLGRMMPADKTGIEVPEHAMRWV